MPALETIDDLETPFREEIAEILDSYNVFGKGRPELQTYLIKLLEEVASSEVNGDNVYDDMLKNIIRLTDLSDEVADELAHKLIAVAKDMALIIKIQDKEKAVVAKVSSKLDVFGKFHDDSDMITIKKKVFVDAILKDLGDVFHGCPMSPEKRKLMETQLALQYAKDLGIALTDSDFGIESEDAKSLESDITAIVNDWIKTMPVIINNSRENYEFDNNKKNFISKLRKMVPREDFETMKEETKNYMQYMPLDPAMKDDYELLDRKAEELIQKLATMPSESKASPYGMSFGGLTGYIDDWLNNVHITDQTKSENDIKNMKKDLAYNLVNKIGEMNVDPEIFNDDTLYEDILKDELNNLLGNVTITDENFQALKEDLIGKVKGAQQRAHDEIAGQTYKHNLRDTLSSILPDQRNLSKEEQATTEILKDQLADAFINLHYAGSNENLRAQLKRKISNEINNFCQNYLQRHPETPLNSQRLNQDLYNALNKVSLPAENSMRYEVEQVRIRDEINNWLREIPLQPQSPAELLARNKMVYVLARKLFDIETEGNDTVDNALMKKEITKFLNKMPLQPGESNNLPQYADKLIYKLKASEASRKFSNSSKSTSAREASSMDEPVCPYYKSILERQKAQPAYSFPPCSLCPEDIAHLERIRRRTCLSPKCVSSLLRNNKRNAGVGPRPVDTGSQTELGAFESFEMELHEPSPICPASDDKMPRPCPGVPASISNQSDFRKRQSGYKERQNQSGYPERRPNVPSRRHQNDSRGGEVQPHIIVKEYYWDTEGNMQQSDVQGSDPYNQRVIPPCHPPPMPPCRRSPRAPPCHRPTAPVCHRPRTPCPPAEASPYQSDSATGYRPSSAPYQPPYRDVGRGSPYQQTKSNSQQQPDSNLQQQPSPTNNRSTSPGRVPCDLSYPCPRPKPESQTQNDRYPHWQRTFHPSPDRFPHRTMPCPRSPSPCMSSVCSPFGPNQQSTPASAPGYSFRQNDYRVPKRDGLQDQIPCSSGRPRRKERVIELGSLDDLRNARPRKQNNDEFDWSYAKFGDEEGIWGTPCMRRVILDEGIDDSVVMEREKREERVKCRCKERLVPKCSRTHSRPCSRHTFAPSNEDGSNLHRCSKCCGLHCPYPSFLYFRQ